MTMKTIFDEGNHNYYDSSCFRISIWAGRWNGEDITFSKIAITRGDYENLQITYRKYGYDKLVKVMCYCNPVIKKYIGYLDVSKYESEEEKKTATIDAFYFVYNRN